MHRHITGHKPNNTQSLKRIFRRIKRRRKKSLNKVKRRSRERKKKNRKEESIPLFFLSIFFILFSFLLSLLNVNILNLLRQDSIFRVRFLFYHQMFSVNIRCYFFYLLLQTNKIHKTVRYIEYGNIKWYK